jgi:hypothetical protein
MIFKSILDKFQKLVCNVSLRLLSYIHIWTVFPKISVVSLMNKGTVSQGHEGIGEELQGRVECYYDSRLLLVNEKRTFCCNTEEE